jgi:hypothetical protein
MLSISPPVILITECLLDAFFESNSFYSVCAGDLEELGFLSFLQQRRLMQQFLLPMLLLD